MTTNEKINYIKDNVSIIEYAGYLGFTVKKIGKYYTLKEHDSVRINPYTNKFYRNSTSSSDSSGSVFNFAMHFQDLTFNEALKELCAYVGESVFETEMNVPHKPTRPPMPQNKKAYFVLPEHGNTRKHIYAYLNKTRFISKEIIDYFCEKKLLYEDDKYNCVFVGYDMADSNTPIFACKKGTNTQKSFRGDVEGSNYDYCFYIHHENADTLYVNEAVIDTMSVMSLLPKERRYNVSYLALAGTQKWQAIFNFLLANPEIEYVYLGMDNDRGGREVLDVIKTYAKEHEFTQVFQDFLPERKDWNEELKFRSKGEFQK